MPKQQLQYPRLAEGRFPEEPTAQIVHEQTPSLYPPFLRGARRYAAVFVEFFVGRLSEALYTEVPPAPSRVPDLLLMGVGQ